MWARLLVRINPAIESPVIEALRLGNGALLLVIVSAMALLDRDPRVDGNNEATRHVHIEVILIVAGPDHVACCRVGRTLDKLTHRNSDGRSK